MSDCCLTLYPLLLASPAPTHGGDQLVTKGRVQATTRGDIESEHRGSGLHARPAGTSCMSDTTQGEGDAHTYRPAYEGWLYERQGGRALQAQPKVEDEFVVSQFTTTVMVNENDKPAVQFSATKLAKLPDNRLPAANTP